MSVSRGQKKEILILVPGAPELVMLMIGPIVRARNGLLEHSRNVVTAPPKSIAVGSPS